VTDVITFSGEFRPGAARLPQPSPEWHLKFLTAEADSTARLMGFYENARLELETFIRTGDLTVSDARFYRDLLDETNRIATDLNKNGAVWVSSTIPEAYTAGRRLTSSVVIPQDALSALSREPLALITQTTEQMRNGIRQTIAAGILEGLPASELRARMLAGGLTNIPHWPSAEYRAGVIARTETMRAFNAGNLEGLKENGARYVRWIASPDEATCDICLPREGQVFRLSGTDPGEPYPDAPLLDDPPAHPRCRCTVRAEYRNPDGEVIRNEPGQPPPIEVEPVLSEGDMGASSPPMLPPAVGDLKKALAGLKSKTLTQDLDDWDTLSSLRGSRFVSEEGLARLARLDESVGALKAFWQNADLRNAAGFYDDLAAMTSTGAANFFRLRYGINVKGWSTVDKAHRAWLAEALDEFETIGFKWRDSPALKLWEFGAIRQMNNPAYYSPMEVKVRMMESRYPFDGSPYRIGDRPYMQSSMLHELGHALESHLIRTRGMTGRNLWDHPAWDAIHDATKGKGVNAQIRQVEEALSKTRSAIDDARRQIEYFRMTAAERSAETTAFGIRRQEELIEIYERSVKGLEDQLAIYRKMDRIDDAGAFPGRPDYEGKQYSASNGREDFADSVLLYILDPAELRRISPARYRYIFDLFPEGKNR
jgi:SPP1 gp7 family putative phage head morphogenesis protein